MQKALVIGMGKTGTTIVASVIWNSIVPARLELEPLNVAFFEKRGKSHDRLVVKILYEHWMERHWLLTGIVRGETGFRADRTVALIRDPRDALISALMYMPFQRVVNGARKEQIDQWVRIVGDKEANPERYSVLDLIEHLNRIFDAAFVPDWYFENFLRYARWMAGNTDYFHPLRYEDFVAGKTSELSAYLGIELSSSREVDPALRRVARTRQSGGWRAMMLPKDVAYWRARYDNALATHGYFDWDIQPEKSDPAFGSEYILDITEEAFRSRAT